MQLSKRKKYCRVCDSVIDGKLWVWNNEILCSKGCWEEFQNFAQEYDLTEILEEDNNEWKVFTK